MLKPKFKVGDLKKLLKAFGQKVHDAIIDRFNYVGESFVSDAKLNHTYKDDTGNLTASIGYITLFNGRKVSPGAIPSQSKKLVTELIMKFGKGYVLIVFAGMNYAAAVESKGRDVITGSSIRATTGLKNALKTMSRSLGL